MAAIVANTLSIRSRPKLLTAILVAAVACAAGSAQSRIVEITFHSRSLEHNLLGDPADQPVFVYLPDAYFKQLNRRFPVLYFLYGYADPPSRREAEEFFKKTMDQLVARLAVQPMILVVPNGLNKYRGSFYANSRTTGNWDDYVTRDLVAYVDNNFRTLPIADRRAIAGHSMGGYGALTLAFRHPNVFSSVYAMSPCCTDLIEDLGPANPAWSQLNQLSSPADVPQALDKGHFFLAAFSALDAALAPDPQARTMGDAPFYVDHNQLKTNPVAFAAISASLPVHMVRPLLGNIMRLKGIFIEYGAQDEFTHIPAGARALSRELAAAGVPHTLEVFQGDHESRLERRIAGHMLPWMSQQLYAVTPDQ